MKIKDLKIAWRILLRQPVHSLIVFLGLSVSFCVCFLLLGYARFSFEYDAHVPDAKRIFLVKHRLNVLANPTWVDFSVWPLEEKLGQSGLPHSLASVNLVSRSVSVTFSSKQSPSSTPQTPTKPHPQFSNRNRDVRPVLRLIVHSLKTDRAFRRTYTRTAKSVARCVWSWYSNSVVASPWYQCFVMKSFGSMQNEGGKFKEASYLCVMYEIWRFLCCALTCHARILITWVHVVALIFSQFQVICSSSMTFQRQRWLLLCR